MANPFIQQQDPEELAILRRQQMAQQLMQQAQQPMEQGSMAGRIYVKPSITQYLAKGLQQYMGARGVQQADEEAKALYEGRQAQTQADRQKLATLLSPTPAITLPEDQQGPVAPQQPADLNAATMFAMQSKDPALQSFAFNSLANQPALAEARANRAEERQFRIDQLARDHQNRMEVLAANNASQAAMQAERQAFMLGMKNLGGAGQQPYYQPLQTTQGVVAFNSRTGKIEPVMGADNKPIVGAQNDPLLQGQVAGAKAGATTEAKARTEAKLMAPQAIAQADETVKLIDDLLKAPGLKQAVGASRLTGMQNIPGTKAKDFDIRLAQLKGKQFLQAFESLKGGGAITEVEGKKATDAIARMDASGSEEEFIKASKEFQEIIREGAKRAKAMAGGNVKPIGNNGFTYIGVEQ